MMNIHHIVLC